MEKFVIGLCVFLIALEILGTAIMIILWLFGVVAGLLVLKFFFACTLLLIGIGLTGSFIYEILD